jgi:hypothetical protein
MTDQPATPTASCKSATTWPLARAIAIGWLYISLLSAAVWIWWSGQNNVARLPAPERGAFYERTRGTLTALCDPSKGLMGLDDYCREQAELILQFPECDAACRALAEQQRFLPLR